MTKHNNDEMSQTIAAGCRFFKRMARRGLRGGDGAGSLEWGKMNQIKKCI